MNAPTAWCDAVADLIEAAHLVAASGIPAIVDEATEPIGVTVRIYLTDHEQRHLRPLSEGEPLAIGATLAGRAFMTLRPMPSSGDRPGMWMPMVNGTERIGVLEVRLPPGTDPVEPDVVTGTRLLAGLIGHLITAKRAYGDTLAQARRSQPMTPAAELLWQLLPPLTFATDQIVLGAVLEPCYDVGGDAYDYSVDGYQARFGVFDAVGKGMPAAVAAAVALGAIRATRRAGGDLAGMAEAADQAITAQFPDARFVTAILAELDLAEGGLRYVGAGHPPPVLLRRGKAVRALGEGRRAPLGVPSPVQVAEESFEPGDRLLVYTDGVTEARDADGAMFGVDHLVDLVERHAADGLPAAETVRRISHAVLEHQGGPPKDDASLLLVEWSPQAASRSKP
jgi:sigma-B regulation protein RsbU (phosphoserine phosphatase)